MSAGEYPRPALFTRWTSDGVDVCQVRATWEDGAVVRWPDKREGRRCIYTPLAEFYRALRRHVEPFDPARHADRFSRAD